MVEAAQPRALFRQQALLGATRRDGRALSLQLPASRALVALFLLLASGVLILFFCGSFTRQVRASGALLPRAGLVRIAAPQSGIVMQSLAAEGQQVRADQPLLKLASDRLIDDGSLAVESAALWRVRRASLASEADQLQRQSGLRERALREQLARLTEELSRLREQQQLQERRVQLARQAWQRFESLRAQGFVATAQLQDREADLLDQQRAQTDLQRTMLAIEQQRAGTRAELQSQQLQRQRDAQSSARALADIDQQLLENAARREQVIAAPRPGTIGTWLVQQGQSVAAGQLIATLLPVDATLEAVLLAPAQAITSMRVGMPVWLRYHGWPYRKYGQYRGTLRDISPVALDGDELAHGSGVPARSSEPQYRLRVALDRQSITVQGRPVALLPGMTLDASLPADRRRLYQWLLEPLTITRAGA